MLQAKFEMYSLNNDLKENEELKATHYRDFYNVRKVDTHIHAAGSMNTKHFLTFVRNAFKKVTLLTYLRNASGKNCVFSLSYLARRGSYLI